MLDAISNYKKEVMEAFHEVDRRIDRSRSNSPKSDKEKSIQVRPGGRGDSSDEDSAKAAKFRKSFSHNLDAK